MPFTIDEDNLLIKGRKGDTASFRFDFEEDISAYTVTFGIVSEIGSDPIIEKTFENPTTQYVDVELSTTDTELLDADGDSPGIYYWYLKRVTDTTFAETIIPEDFKPAPQFRVYPEIGIGEN